MTIVLGRAFFDTHRDEKEVYNIIACIIGVDSVVCALQVPVTLAEFLTDGKRI